jgi:hypothetical protein
VRKRIHQFAFGIAVTALASPALANQWKVTLERIVVAPAKPSGQPWDADNSVADVIGAFGVGTIREGKCDAMKSEQIAKHQNTLELAPGLSIVGEAERAADLCFRVVLLDKDLVENDPIGSVTASLAIGTHDYEAGAARVTVHVSGNGAVEAGTPDVQLDPPPPPRPLLYKVTVVTARIHPSKADGLSWDAPADTDAENERFLGSLKKIGLSAPVLAATQGASAAMAFVPGGSDEAASYKERTAAAPDPRVVLRWGDLTLVAPGRRNTLNPRWDFQFIVPADVAERRPMRVTVLDADDGDDETIGADSIPGKDVVKDEVFRKTFGGVEELVLEVEKVSEDTQGAEKSIKVDTTKGWIDTGVDVVAGQMVRVTAMGTHCLGGGCVGPEGGKAIAFQRDAQEDGAAPPLHAGELGAFVGGDIFPVGRAGQFKARASGRLRLGVASKASSGSLTATVTVFYPLVQIAPEVGFDSK